MKGTWDSDRDPLAALRRGDPSVFEEFVRDEAGSLIAFFGRLGAERTEAEDLSQEVFLKLYRSASTYEPRSTFGSFVLRVAKNAWIDRRRRSGARPVPWSLNAAPGVPGTPEGEAGTPLKDALAARGPAPWRGLERDDLARRLAHAVGRLPEGQAVVFDLAVVQRLPYPRIAALLEIPVGTVKSRVFTAVRTLRGMLEEPSAERAGDGAGATGEQR